MDPRALGYVALGGGDANGGDMLAGTALTIGVVRNPGGAGLKVTPLAPPALATAGSASPRSELPTAVYPGGGGGMGVVP